jgi:LysM repeat protein
MKTKSFFLSLFLVLAVNTPLHSQTEVERLRRLCAEQEKQIQQLELRIAQLTNTPVPPPHPQVAVTCPLPEPTAKTTSAYTVKAGDNIHRIARQHGTTANVLNQLNGLKTDSIIHPGQNLKLPASTSVSSAASPSTSSTAASATAVTHPIPSTSSKTIQHTVTEKETFYSISRKYNVSLNSLKKSNPTINPDRIRIGQTLQVVTMEARPPEPSQPQAFPASASITQNTHPANNPAPAPPPTHQTGSNQPIPPSDKPIKITQEISYGEFAASYKTSTQRLDELNGLQLDPSTILAKGSELYIPNQP